MVEIKTEDSCSRYLVRWKENYMKESKNRRERERRTKLSLFLSRCFCVTIEISNKGKFIWKPVDSFKLLKEIDGLSVS